MVGGIIQKFALIWQLSNFPPTSIYEEKLLTNPFNKQ